MNSTEIKNYKKNIRRISLRGVAICTNIRKLVLKNRKTTKYLAGELDKIGHSVCDKS